MTTCIDWTDVDAAAEQLAGNHRRFESFGWHAEPEDSDAWCVVYTHNRDSDLLDQSNAATIDKAMAPHTEGDDPDAVSERHGHWACGWVDGYAIRVHRGGQVTEAFRTWCEFQAAMADYPVLDDSDHSEREYKAALNAISQEGGRYIAADAPDDWTGQVFSWLWENDQGELENRDGNGAYPSEESILAALLALDLELDTTYVVRIGGHVTLETVSKRAAFKEARTLAWHQSIGIMMPAEGEVTIEFEWGTIDTEVWED